MELVTWCTARAKDLVASETKDVEGGEETRKIHNNRFGTNNLKKIMHLIIKLERTS